MENIENKPQIPELHEEIAELEKKLEEKRRQALEAGLAERPEKEVFKEVVKERIEEKRAQKEIAGAPQVQAGQAPATVSTDELQKLSEQKQLEELINVAMTKSPIDAVHIAQNLKNPKLLDDLHDYLVDNLYDHLVEKRKLISLK